MIDDICSSAEFMNSAEERRHKSCDFPIKLDLSENVNIAIYGAFFIGFLCFFLLNAFYLGYEICLLSFMRFHSAVVKLYSCVRWLMSWNRLKILIALQVWVLTQIFQIFFYFTLVSLQNVYTKFRDAVTTGSCVRWFMGGNRLNIISSITKNIKFWPCKETCEGLWGSGNA